MASAKTLPQKPGTFEKSVGPTCFRYFTLCLIHSFFCRLAKDNSLPVPDFHSLTKLACNQAPFLPCQLGHLFKFICTKRCRILGTHGPIGVCHTLLPALSTRLCLYDITVVVVVIPVVRCQYSQYCQRSWKVQFITGSCVLETLVQRQRQRSVEVYHSLQVGPLQQNPLIGLVSFRHWNDRVDPFKLLLSRITIVGCVA